MTSREPAEPVDTDRKAILYLSMADYARAEPLFEQALEVEKHIYGEQHPEAELRNLRAAVYLQCDQAAVAQNEAQDFKANLRGSSRRLAQAYDATVDWAAVDAALPVDASEAFDPVALESAIAPQVASTACGDVRRNSPCSLWSLPARYPSMRG